MADNEEISDKLAGHAPARKAGGMRVTAATKSKPAAEKVDEDSTPVANLGGLAGTQPVMTKEQDVAEEVAQEKSEQPHVKVVHNIDNNVPKIQQSHKKVQHNINQPR